MENPVPQNIRSKRSKVLRALSAKKRHQFYESQLGKEASVLFENENKKIEMKSRMMRSSNEDNNKASTSISNVALNFQPLNEVDDGDGV